MSVLLCLVAGAALLTPQRPVVADADTLLINSTILNRQRSVYVSLPASHERSARKYPVLIVLDGEANFGPATTIANTLAGLAH